MKKYDLILDEEGVISMVQGFHLGKIIVHPKYAPNKKGSWKIFSQLFDRVSNPLDPDRVNKKKYKFLDKFGKKDYCILKRNIKKIYLSQNCSKTLLKEKETKTEVRNTAKELIKQLKKYLPIKDIGFTGSVLLNSQKDNFSDIDLIIDFNSYEKFREFVFNPHNPSIRIRSKEEWEEFYIDYKVVCALNKKDFAEHQVKKPDQFFFNNIPVSTFFVDSKSAYLNEELKSPSNSELKGVIVKSKKSMLLPAEYYFLSNDSKKFKIVCFNRAYLNQAKLGDEVKIKGFLKDSNMYIRTNKEDYIKNDKTKFPK